jgi:UDP-N-acetylmuramyl pentapeptide phosphotransferase/UDP-N-acetylglucosamine-1-phosphate transferase
MDGLAAVVAGSICLQIAFLSNYLNQYKLTDIALLLFATIIGFFIFNYPPAKLYLGDSGSLFIGYCLGFLSIIFNWTPANDTIYTSFLNPILLFFAIPLLDFVIVISQRIKSGVSPTTGGTDHISHRFLAAGFTEKKVLTLFLFYTILLFTLILVSIISSKFISYGVIIILLIVFLVTFLKISKMNILE